MKNAQPRPAALHDSVRLSAAIGAAAGTVFAHWMAGDAAAVAIGAVIGISAGAVCGLLLWIGGGDLPEAPIPPVRDSLADAMRRRRDLR